MSDTSLRLDLPCLQPAQAQKHVTHNTALYQLDALVQLSVIAFDAQTPPLTPTPGDIYGLGLHPVGDWAGHPEHLAMHNETNWFFFLPKVGWRAWDADRGRLRVYTADGWQDVRQDMQNIDGIGVGTETDAENRITVASHASLFTHFGAGHQLKINKANDADTAALLFQSDWNGHAEIGLVSDLSFSIKVSPDGASWHTALDIDPASQTITLAPDGTARANLSATALTVDVPIEGDAVQSGPADATSGRLMLAEHGVLRSYISAQSASPAPSPQGL